MKKIYTVVFLNFLTLFLFACQKKDVEYYRQNHQEAQEKYAQCNADKIKNKEPVGSPFREAECRAAYQVAFEQFMEAKRKKQEREHQAYLKSQAEKEKRYQEKIKQEKLQAEKEFKQQYGSMTWKQLIPAFGDSECAQDYIGGDSPFCVLFKAKIEDAFKQGTNEIGKTPILELLKQKDKYCKLRDSKFSICGVWRATISEQTSEYLADKSFDEVLSLENDFCRYKKHGDICSGWAEIIEKKTEEFAKTKDLLFLKTVFSDDKYCELNTKRDSAVCRVFLAEYQKQRDEYRSKLSSDDAFFTAEYNKCREFYLSLSGTKTDKWIKIKDYLMCYEVDENVGMRKMDDKFDNFGADL